MKKLITKLLIVYAVCLGFATLTLTSCGPSARELYMKAIADSIFRADSIRMADSTNLAKKMEGEILTPTDIVKLTDKRKYHITYMMKDVVYQNDSVILIRKNR